MMSIFICPQSFSHPFEIPSSDLPLRSLPAHPSTSPGSHWPLFCHRKLVCIFQNWRYASKFSWHRVKAWEPYRVTIATYSSKQESLRAPQWKPVLNLYSCQLLSTQVTCDVWWLCFRQTIQVWSLPFVLTLSQPAARLPACWRDRAPSRLRSTTCVESGLVLLYEMP